MITIVIKQRKTGSCIHIVQFDKGNKVITNQH